MISLGEIQKKLKIEGAEVDKYLNQHFLFPSCCNSSPEETEISFLCQELAETL